MKKILLIQLRQLGDILLTTPAIREVRHHFPKAHLAFLSHPMGRLILEGTPYLDEIFYYDPKSIWQECLLIQQLRARRFDIVVDFMNNPRSALYTVLSGSPLRLAFDSRRSFAYSQTVPRSVGSDYIVRDKFRLIREIGITGTRETLDLPWFENHLGPLKSMDEQLPGFRDAGLRVILSPTHRREVRRWPLASYAALAERLHNQWGATVVWIWGPGEEQEIDEVMRLTQVPTVKAFKTSFRELAALIANCDLFVGNSNGPSHVAVATGICSYQLHGPTLLRAWCPMNRIHRGVQSPLRESQPEQSMAAISVDQVWGGLQDMKVEIDHHARWRKRSGISKNWQEIHKL